jgi:AcrR family transcriptional regulator
MCQTKAMTDSQATPSGPGARRRGGRRPGSSRSRQKILEVARLAFPANGYAETSLRGIARDAGVDPSLIVQLFGSKAGLFAAVVEWPFDASEIAAQVQEVPPDGVGEFAARRFIGHWDRDEHRNPILSLIYAALADPGAAAMFREFITVNLTLPVVERVGADRPQLRAALLASQLVGFGLSRYVLGFDALVSASSEELVAALGATLQDTCTSPLSGL